MNRILTADHAVTLIDPSALADLGRCTLCVALDDHHRPVRQLCFEASSSDTFVGTDNDDVLDIAELVGRMSSVVLASHVIVVSVRPGEPFCTDDIDRWFVLSSILESADVALLEWFIHDGHTMSAVTPLVGEPSVWPGDDRSNRYPGR